MAKDFKLILQQPLEKNKDVILGFRKPFNVKKEDFEHWINTVIIGDLKKFELLRQKRLLGFQRKIVEKYDELVPQRSMFLVVCSNLEEELKEGENLLISQSIQESFTFLPDEVVLYRKIIS